MAVSKNWRPLFASPYNKSPAIWGSILGPLIFGISHIRSLWSTTSVTSEAPRSGCQSGGYVNTSAASERFEEHLTPGMASYSSTILCIYPVALRTT